MAEKNFSKFSFKTFELGARFCLPIFIHIMHMNVVNSLVNIIMIEPDFGTIVFIIACSLYLQKFDTLLVHEVYMAETKFFLMVQEVIFFLFGDY